MHQLETLPEPAVDTPDVMTPTWFRTRRARRETADTFSLDLEAERGETNFEFNPGQFNMLYVFGVGEVPISISGDPANTELLIHTTRAVGVVTRAMARLRRGDLIGIRGPFGSAWPMREAVGKDVVIVTGGIGLAPLRPALYHLLSNRDQYKRIMILYGARTPDDMLFRDEIKEWRARLDIDVDVTVDRGGGRWRGNVGVVTTLIPRANFDPESTIAMVCGPEVMMRFTVQALEQRGLCASQIFVSMERNMKCAVGFCGHCQFGGSFVCKDGPVYRFDRIAPIFGIREM